MKSICFIFLLTFGFCFVSCDLLSTTKGDSFVKEQFLFDSVGVEILIPDYFLDFKYSKLHEEYDLRFRTVDRFHSIFADDTMSGVYISYMAPAKESYFYNMSLEKVMEFLEAKLGAEDVEAKIEKLVITTFNGRDFVYFKYISDTRTPHYYTAALWTKINSNYLRFYFQAFQTGTDYYEIFRQDIPKMIESIKIEEI